MWKISYSGDDAVIETAAGDCSILDLSLENRIPHMSECGGNGRCTTCRIRVLDGIHNLTPRTPREERIAERRGWDEFIRLACQTRSSGDVIVKRLVHSPGDVSEVLTEVARRELGREMQLAILFCDIREFTPFVENHLPYDVIHLLNRYFAHIGEPILTNNGYIDIYVGDAVVAYFGMNGGSPETNCLNAVRAGLGIVHSLARLNHALREEFELEFHAGIGINFGSAIVGSIGHPSKQQFTAIGDAVNTAARIQSANKELGTTLLAAKSVIDTVGPALRIGKSASLPLKGKKDPAELCELLGFSEPDDVLIVQMTFGCLLNDLDRFVQTFYEEMFRLVPAMREMFRNDMTTQRHLVTHTLATVVRGLSRFNEIAPALRLLGKRHIGYGVQPEQYELFRQALSIALAKMLGEHYDDAARKAWDALYDRMVSAMTAPDQANTHNPAT